MYARMTYLKPYQNILEQFWTNLKLWQFLANEPIIFTYDEESEASRSTGQYIPDNERKVKILDWNPYNTWIQHRSDRYHSIMKCTTMCRLKKTPKKHPYYKIWKNYQLFIHFVNNSNGKIRARRFKYYDVLSCRVNVDINHLLR